ncbi:hypothetical protein [Spirosoma fluminis]
MNSDVDFLKAEGLIRFMLYTDINRRRATQLGPDIWTDYETVYGGRYSYKSRLELCFLDINPKPKTYVVAMLPYIRHIEHPDRPGVEVPIRTVYLVSETLWPFFEPVTDENLTTAILPL